MKFFVISDIHGSKSALDRALVKFKEEKADYILILGDILYHGPRNPIPEGYDPASVATILNTYKEKIIAIRGNCDSEVDQMLLEFPIMSDFSNIFLGNKRVFATHGHLPIKDSIALGGGDILISGHTHLPLAEKDTSTNRYIFNPGSITLPKENNPHSYGILTPTSWEVKTISESKVFKSIKF